MANPIFQMLTRQNPFNQNPIDVLANKGINIPKENQGSPKDMVNYLLENGNMNRDAFNQAVNRLQKMGFKF